jgi:UDP-N-acetyl-2-amino-2-deoxyglucuronate dehydrogenase
MSKIINFALIGTGGIAEKHIVAINAVKEANLLGVLSLSNLNKAKKIANKYNVKVYTDYLDVLNDDKVEAIDIVSRNDMHAKLGIKAADHKKHVLVEKPLTTNLNDADKLINACFKNKVKLSNVFQNRFADIYQRLKEDICKGKFGKVILVKFSWCLYKNNNYFLSSPWRKSKKQAGGGLLIMNIIHYIDLLLWFFGPAVSVTGKIKNRKFKNIQVEDTVWAVIRFKNDIEAIIYGTIASPVSAPPSLEIYGAKKNFSFKDSLNLINKEKLFAEQISNFTQAIQKNKKPLIGGREGRNSLEVVLNIYRSSKLNREVKLH